MREDPSPSHSPTAPEAEETPRRRRLRMLIEVTASCRHNATDWGDPDYANAKGRTLLDQLLDSIEAEISFAAVKATMESVNSGKERISLLEQSIRNLSYSLDYVYAHGGTSVGRWTAGQYQAKAKELLEETP